MYFLYYSEFSRWGNYVGGILRRNFPTTRAKLLGKTLKTLCRTIILEMEKNFQLDEFGIASSLYGAFMFV